MDHLIDEAQQYLMNTYTRQPLIIHKGRGTRVYDPNGKEYLDFVGGVAVNNLGHCHPNVTVAFQKQAQRLVHVSNLYYTEPQVKLARLLVEHSFADKVFFCNSGTEAIEAAIKLVRKFSREKFGPDRYEIITMEQSFHGRTLAAVTATAQPKYHKGFEPLVPGFRYVPYNDLKAVSNAISDRTAAILVEPAQGEGGVRIPDPDYLPGLRKLCDEKGLLLVLDEVQTGIGRTGRLFGYEHSGIEPDIMALAKGLGSGLPIGALLAKDSVARAFTPGSHAATFGGNPLVCAAAIATLEVLLEEGFILDNCRRMGEYFVERLKGLQQRHPCVVSVRGLGLLVGMELAIDGKPIVQDCLEEGLLINCTMDRVLRFVPPLIILKEEIDLLINRLDGIFKKRTA
ncbi:MAG TPA: acetylornithine transaminase [Nitrospiria bacterium]|jgi:predicted acetylornithine/succinylornithine family transaminase|nr:acetylornithine transaminase [Nitrospiria bacterium]